MDICTVLRHKRGTKEVSQRMSFSSMFSVTLATQGCYKGIAYITSLRRAATVVCGTYSTCGTLAPLSALAAAGSMHGKAIWRSQTRFMATPLRS